MPAADHSAGTDLPIRTVLPELLDALRRAGTAVLVAPPGTGKTTLVPLALADAVDGRIVVAEPRRVAARAAAHRMAALLGEQVGGRVGYTVRGERRVGATTRVEVVTTGLLVRRLQHDPQLPGVSALLLDECHERQVDADLALAFAAEVRAALRPDLWVLAASATPDSATLAAILDDAPVVEAQAQPHPVRITWCPPPQPVRPTLGPRVDPGLLAQVSATVRRALSERSGDVLVFLPGAAEIDRVAGQLGTLPPDIDVLTLHGRQSAATQDAALRPGTRRRVVLASGIAESSVTVPGVRVVVDAGLARVPRTDHARGLGSLATVPVSRAAAEQRAGRAGRQGPGWVYRCWSAADHDHLPARPEPEISVADLTGFALQLAWWGVPDGVGLSWVDPPPDAAMRVARECLRALGAVDEAGQVTARGRQMAAVGAHPRLAHALLDGAPTVGDRRAAEIVALLSDESLPGRSDDLCVRWRELRAGGPGAGRWRTEVRRLESALPRHPADRGRAERLGDELAAGLVVGLAFPERLARLRPSGTEYLMAGGTAAVLTSGSVLGGTPWLAVAVADRPAGQPAARIRLAAPIDDATAERAGTDLLSTMDEVDWVDGDVRTRRARRLGAIVLTARPLTAVDTALVVDALRTGLRAEGLALLRWTAAGNGLRDRLRFCRRAFGEPWPEVDDPALLARLADWLGPELAGCRRRADLARIDAGTALRRLVPWPQAGELDRLAPERLKVPSGSTIRLDYTDPAAPVLAVKVQEVFGWRSVPAIADGRVPVLLHLLSPAGRPVAVTADLESFWHNGYPQVRADLRGRYPRHPWPADPIDAQPTGRAKPRH